MNFLGKKIRVKERFQQDSRILNVGETGIVISKDLSQFNYKTFWVNWKGGHNCGLPSNEIPLGFTDYNGWSISKERVEKYCEIIGSIDSVQFDLFGE